jgi:hypothetical protein
MDENGSTEPTDDARELDQLRQEVAALRAAISTEIRTRRVTVVEPDGFERIVLEAQGRFGSIAVRTRSKAAPTEAGLFGNDPIDGDGSHVGIALTDQGDVVAAFEVLQGREAVLWTEPPESS